MKSNKIKLVALTLGVMAANLCAVSVGYAATKTWNFQNGIGLVDTPLTILEAETMGSASADTSWLNNYILHGGQDYAINISFTYTEGDPNAGVVLYLQLPYPNGYTCTLWLLPTTAYMLSNGNLCKNYVIPPLVKQGIVDLNYMGGQPS